MDKVESVTTHYESGGIRERVLAGLRDPEALSPEDLKPFESLHVGGWEATEELLSQIGIAPGARVLDIGCGIGGTARVLASDYGAEVVGVDVTPDFIAAAAALSARAGVRGVHFIEGSALDLEFGAGHFDHATMLHVGMNIADKGRLFAEVARVLRPGGRFAVYDLMRAGPGDLTYPMPWAVTAEMSFVEPPEVYLECAEAAGFVEIGRRDRTEVGIARMEARKDRGPATAGIPPERLGNALAALRAGRLAPVEMVFQRD